MAVNWGMGGPQNNALAYFQFGNQLGSQVRERQELRDKQAKEEAGRKSLADYAVNPTDQGFAAAVQYDPRSAIAMRGSAQEQQQKQTEQRRADLPLIGRLLDHAQDETSYQQARTVASQYGIDVSQLPANYDPAWVNQQRMTIKALSDPKAQEALSAAGKIAMDMGFKPGTPEFNAKVAQIWQTESTKYIPVTAGGSVAAAAPGQDPRYIIGGAPSGGPAAGGGVSEGATATNPQTGERIIFKGGQWVPMGGGGSNVTSNFLDGL